MLALIKLLVRAGHPSRRRTYSLEVAVIPMKMVSVESAFIGGRLAADVRPFLAFRVQSEKCRFYRTASLAYEESGHGGMPTVVNVRIPTFEHHEGSGGLSLGGAAPRHMTITWVGGIAPRPCKKRQDGAPTVPERDEKNKTESRGRPP